MRALSLIGALGAAVLGIGIAQAQAAPAAPDRAPSRGPIVAVQVHCDHLRCIDMRTGAYSQSTCNSRGCRPLGGVIGHTDPRSLDLGYGYGSDFPPGDHRWREQRRWGWDRYYGN